MLTSAYGSEWNNWRRRQITDLVAQIHTEVKSGKPNLIVSAAVFANCGDAYTSRFQDWKLWMREGYLDLLCPMAYSEKTETVTKQIADAVSSANQRPVWAGIGS